MKEDLTKERIPAHAGGRNSKNQPLNKPLSETFMTSLLPKNRRKAEVGGVVDGDTVTLKDGSTVRLEGIDTPETGKFGASSFPKADEAKARLEELLSDGNVTLELESVEQDKYNRTLATILTSDDRNVQQILLQEGLAKAMSIEPNTRLSKYYEKLEQEAKDNQVGLWANPAVVVPVDSFGTHVPVGYVGAHEGGGDRPISNQTSPTAPTAFWENAANLILEDGVSKNTYNWLQDFNAQEDPKDLDLVEASEGIIAAEGLPPEAVDLLLPLAQNKAHLALLAKRLMATQRTAKGRDAMSFSAQIGSGIFGFIGDPVNIALGMPLLKLPGLAAKFLPTATSVLVKRVPSLTGKAAAYTAFAVTEEAIRTTPRLNADPAYNMDAYLTNVAVAGAFGLGIARALPAIKWTNQAALTPALKTMDAGITASWKAATESMTIRTAVNIMKGSPPVGKRAKSAHKKVVDDLDTHGFVRRARDKAKEDVKESAVINKISSVRQSIGKIFNSKELDLDSPELLTDLTEAMDTIIKESPTVSKEFKTIAKEVEKTTAEGVEPKPKTFQDTLNTIHELELKAKEAIGVKEGDAVARKAFLTVEQVALQAARSVEAAAARRGVKMIRKRSTPDQTNAALISQAKALNSKHETSTILANIEELSGELTPKNSDSADYIFRLTRPLDSIIQRLTADNVSGTIDGLVRWIVKDANLVQLRATHAREQVTLHFNRLLDDVDVNWVGNRTDARLGQLKAKLRAQQDELESLLDATGMAHHNRFTDLLKIDPRWAALSEEFESSVGRETLRKIEKAYDSTIQKLNSNQMLHLTQSLATRLFRSKVPLAQMQAMNIFELPAGVAGYTERQVTAALIAKRNTDIFTNTINLSWRNMMAEAAKDLGFGIKGKAELQNFNPNTPGAVQEIAREVMRTISDLQMGKTPTSKPYIQKFAKEFDEVNNKMYKLQAENNVDGITGANQMKNYLRQSWNDSNIITQLENTGIGRVGVVNLLAKSIHSRAAGALKQNEAKLLADTFIDIKLEAMNKPNTDSFTLRTENLQSSMAALEDVINRIQKKRNVSPKAMDAILKWAKIGTGGRAGYVHQRTINLDYSTTITRNGKTVSILDLLDNDVVGSANRYAKEASGRSALSKVTDGRLNSEQAIDDLINATQRQATEMGTVVNTKDMRNAYRELLGIPYDGQLPIDVRKIRDMVALTFMGGLGESQLAETGLATMRGISGLFAINQLASKTIGRAKNVLGIELTEAQKTNTKFLNELMEYSGFMEDSHIMARQNVHFDERIESKATKVLSKVVDTVTGGKYRPLLQYLQTRYTGYGAIRTLQEQVAMAGLVQDAMKTVRQMLPTVRHEVIPAPAPTKVQPRAATTKDTKIVAIVDKLKHARQQKQAIEATISKTQTTTQRQAKALNNWSSEIKSQLKKLDDEGISKTEINEALGKRVTAKTQKELTELHASVKDATPQELSRIANPNVEGIHNFYDARGDELGGEQLANATMYTVRIKVGGKWNRLVIEKDTGKVLSSRTKNGGTQLDDMPKELARKADRKALTDLATPQQKEQLGSLEAIGKIVDSIRNVHKPKRTTQSVEEAKELRKKLKELRKTAEEQGLTKEQVSAKSVAKTKDNLNKQLEDASSKPEPEPILTETQGDVIPNVEESAAKQRNSFTTPKRFKDLGLDLNMLRRYLDDGTIELTPSGNIATLNMHRWSTNDQTHFGAIMQRHVGQQVQFAHAGERSPQLLNPVGAMLLQFQSYPILAAEKQIGRNLMMHDKEAGMSILANAASSAAARIVRYYSLAAALPEDKRERYLEKKFSEDFMVDTYKYMGTAGTLVNNATLAGDIFGEKPSLGDQIPAMSWFGNVVKAGQAFNPLRDGEITEHDYGTAARAIPLGTTMWLNGMFGALRNLMHEDSRKPDHEENTNRGG